MCRFAFLIHTQTLQRMDITLVTALLIYERVIIISTQSTNSVTLSLVPFFASREQHNQSQVSSTFAGALYVGCDPKCSQIHIIYLYFMWSCTWDGKYFLSSGLSPLFSVHFTVMCWTELFAYIKATGLLLFCRLRIIGLYEPLMRPFETFTKV